MIEATLNLASPTDGSVAQSLDLTLSVYQNGILRILIEEPDVKRFRISQLEVLQPVVDEQLEAIDLTNRIEWSEDFSSFSISGLTHEAGDESWEYTIDAQRFRIQQVTSDGDETRTIVVNPEDTFYFETETGAPSKSFGAEGDNWDIA